MCLGGPDRPIVCSSLLLAAKVSKTPLEENGSTSGDSTCAGSESPYNPIVDFVPEQQPEKTLLQGGLWWRVRNTFLEFCGDDTVSEQQQHQGSSKRAVSLDSGNAARKTPSFIRAADKDTDLSPDCHPARELKDAVLQTDDKNDSSYPLCGSSKRTFSTATGSRFTSCEFESNLSEDVPNSQAVNADVDVHGGQANQTSCDADKVTSMMLRNIACRFSQEDIAEVLDAAGFGGAYTWIYTPRSAVARRTSNLGYAFVSFISPEWAQKCRSVFDGASFGPGRSKKCCQVVPANNQAQLFGPKKARCRPLCVRAKVEPTTMQDSRLMASQKIADGGHRKSRCH